MVEIEGFGNFRLRGSGGFADVYEADESALSRRVAVKVFRARVGGDERRSFEREAHALGRLSGIRNVVQVFQSGVTDDGHPYFVMELMEGSLADVLAAGPLPVTDACQAGVLLGRALMAAHREGIMHRDIKPGNVLIDRYGEPALSDFGISGVADTGTSSFIYAFSAEHAAPEVFDRLDPTPATDIYSLACTLYASIEGHTPFVRDENEGALSFMRRVQDEPCPPCAAALAFDPGLDVLLRSALAKDPAERPSLDEFVDGLAGVAPQSQSQPSTGGEALLVPPRPHVVVPRSGAPTVDPAVSSGGLFVDDSLPGVAYADGDGGRGSRSSWRVLVGAAVVVAVVGIGVGVAVSASNREDRDEPATIPTSVAPDPTGEGPDVELRPNGVTNAEAVPGLADTSGVLRSNIERFATTTSAAAVRSASTRKDYGGEELLFGTPPVRLDTASTNARTTTKCVAVYAEGLVVVGAAGSFWSDGQLLVAVNAVQFDTELHATQFFWMTAMYFGLANDDCKGWPDRKPAVNPVDLQIDRRDFELVAPTKDVVAVIDDDPMFGEVEGGILYQVVARVDDRVITASVTSVSEVLDPAIATMVLNDAIAAFPPN